MCFIGQLGMYTCIFLKKLTRYSFSLKFNSKQFFLLNELMKFLTRTVALFTYFEASSQPKIKSYLLLTLNNLIIAWEIPIKKRELFYASLTPLNRYRYTYRIYPCLLHINELICFIKHTLNYVLMHMYTL